HTGNANALHTTATSYEKPRRTPVTPTTHGTRPQEYPQSTIEYCLAGVPGCFGNSDWNIWQCGSQDTHALSFLSIETWRRYVGMRIIPDRQPRWSQGLPQKLDPDKDGCPAPTLNRRDDLNGIGRSGHRHASHMLSGRPCPVSLGPISVQIYHTRADRHPGSLAIRGEIA